MPLIGVLFLIRAQHGGPAGLARGAGGGGAGAERGVLQGEVTVLAELTEDVMSGVVSLPHGFGHQREGVQLRVASAHAGVSVNDLTDETLAILAPVCSALDRALRAELAVLAVTEQHLKDAKIEASAQIDALDLRLDPVVDRLSNALLDRTNQNRDAELYQRYFGSKRPHEVKKPVLGVELTIVRDFLSSLLSSTDAGLKAIGQELEKLVAAATKAETAYGDADSKLRDFRKVGERKAFIDKVNHTRQLTHGEL